MMRPFDELPRDEQRRMILDDIVLDRPRTFDQWQELGFFPMKGEHGTRNKWGHNLFSFSQVIHIHSTESESR